MENGDLSKLRIKEADRHSTKKRRSRRFRILLIIFIAAAIAGAAGFLWTEGLLTPPVEAQTYKVAMMYPAQALTLVNASGYVVAQRKAAVSSKATGRLAKLNVEEGKRVKAGDIIGVLENEDLKARLEEAKAGLKVAQARLKNTQAELNDATLNYERLKTLKQSGAVSVQAYDREEARWKKATAMERSARFAIEQARAALRVAEVNLDYSYIRAPFDGVILRKHADEGEVVAPFGASLNAKAAVVTMADMDSLMVEVDVSESNLEKVKLGAPCEIRLDAFPGDRFPGRVHMIVPTADRSKATVMTKIKFLEPDKRVLPEMSSKVAFLSRQLKEDEKNAVPTVPQSAVVKSSESKAVFLKKDGRAVKTRIKTGRVWDETVEVLGGISEGDFVITNPPEGLADGSRVRTPE